MRLEIEGKAAVDNPRESQLAKAINALRSYGPSSYASLTDDDGNYVQIAGGGVSCMIERYDASTQRRYRAFHDKPSPVRPDGTILSFRAGDIAMRSDEWFMAKQVLEVSRAFLIGESYPDYVGWRDAPGF